MDNTVLTGYADRVPRVVKAGIKGLADDGALGIVVALMDEGNMTFSELKSKFGLNSSTLSRYLAALQRGDLVRNYYEKRDGRPYSYYEATRLPDVLLNAVHVALRQEAEAEKSPDPKTLEGTNVSLNPRALVLASKLLRAIGSSQEWQQEFVYMGQSAHGLKAHPSIGARAT